MEHIALHILYSAIIGVVLGVYINTFNLEDLKRGDPAFATKRNRGITLSFGYSVVAYVMLFADPISVSTLSVIAGILLATAFMAVFAAMAISRQSAIDKVPFTYGTERLNMPFLAALWLMLACRFMALS